MAKMREWLEGDLSPAEAKGLLDTMFRKIWRRKWTILAFAIIGGGIGWNGVWLYPAKYKAQMLIAVEEGESSGWQNLLAQFGLDVGGLNPPRIQAPHIQAKHG